MNLRILTAARRARHSFELAVEPAGPLVRVINRWRLRRDGEPVLCDFYELLTVEGDRVARIDLVCSGTIPER